MAPCPRLFSFLLPDVVLKADMPNVFSVPIFFIVFRETLEAAIIISVLLGIVEQIANSRVGGDSLHTMELEKEKQSPEGGVHDGPPSLPSDSGDDAERRKLLRKLRIQVRHVGRASFLPPTSFLVL